MIEMVDKSTEFEDLQDILFKHPELIDKVVVFELSVTINTFKDLKKCLDAALVLSKFFDSDVLNVVMFEYQKPNSENMIKGAFTASLPLSQRSFYLLIDLLKLNLISARTLVFSDMIIIRTEKEKYVIKQNLSMDH
jgi:hypothetical protein